VALLLATVTTVNAAAVDSLKSGTPEPKSVGVMTFGPEGILFVADATAGEIYAIATDDTKASEAKEGVKIANLNEKLASLLGIEADKIKINDMAVNPASTNIYLSISRDTKPMIVKIDRKGTPSEFSLKGVKFAKIALPNAGKGESVTCLGYVKDKLYVSGLSTEEFASNLRAIPFPFKEADKGSGVEIFHGAHGKFETKSPVRTFSVIDIKGEANLLAAYQCTPLVKFPVKDLEPGKKVKGTTIAELGNGNRPLDMVVYQKEGKEYILLSNSKRGLMKMPTDGIDKIEGIVKQTGVTGLKYETVKGVDGIEQMAKLNDKQAVVLIRAEKAINLDTIDLP